MRCLALVDYVSGTLILVPYRVVHVLLLYCRQSQQYTATNSLGYYVPFGARARSSCASEHPRHAPIERQTSSFITEKGSALLFLFLLPIVSGIARPTCEKVVPGGTAVGTLTLSPPTQSTCSLQQ